MIERINKAACAELYESELEDNASLEDALFDRVSRDEAVNFIDSLPDSQRSVIMLRCLGLYYRRNSAAAGHYELT